MSVVDHAVLQNVQEEDSGNNALDEKVSLGKFEFFPQIDADLIPQIAAELFYINLRASNQRYLRGNGSANKNIITASNINSLLQPWY